MATKIKTIDRGELKRGVTACYQYNFTPPYVGYDWSVVTVDCALTAVGAPQDNSGAVATRLNQALTINVDNTATYLFQLTETESKNLVPGSEYKDECKLRENGTYAVKPVTGKMKIVQDYVI